jgi:aconitate hydratase
MSPPLVVAYALAGRIDHDLVTEPLGNDRQGNPVYLRDIWPSSQEVDETVKQCIDSEMFRSNYESISEGDEYWQRLKVPHGDTYAWDPNSTYIKKAPYFADMPPHPQPVKDIVGARVLAWLGDSVTTDHISPAGSIKQNSPAGKYLVEHGVKPVDFNSYGSRRGNHEVMVRGTFANVRLRNKLAPGTEGGVTRYLLSNEVMSIFDASMKYQQQHTPLIVLAGKEYGSGSSRDWAAKGPKLLGIHAVIAQSYERIHRSNLVGMGILPLQFIAEEDADALGLNGEEKFDVVGLRQMLDSKFTSGRHIRVKATHPDGSCVEFEATVRIDTPQEILYYQHGGILQFVLRQLLAGWEKPKVVSRGMSTVADPATGSSIT